MTIVGESRGKRGAVIEGEEGTRLSFLYGALENLMFLPKSEDFLFALGETFTAVKLENRSPIKRIHYRPTINFCRFSIVIHCGLVIYIIVLGLGVWGK